MSDLNSFVASLEIPEVDEHLSLRAKTASPAAKRPGEAANDKEEQGYVDDGSTVSFVSGIDPSLQDDVLNSTLLAQLAATKKYDREKQTEKWYRFYTDTLGGVGWVIQNFSFQKYKASGATFEIDKVVVEILAAIATANEIAIVTQTLDTLKKLSNKNDSRYTIFDRSSQSQQAGNFQIALANQSGGKVAMKLGAFYFNTDKSSTNFLWTKYSSSKSSIYQGAQTITLNDGTYGKVRQQIIDKLGDRAKQLVANIDI